MTHLWNFVAMFFLQYRLNIDTFPLITLWRAAGLKTESFGPTLRLLLLDIGRHQITYEEATKRLGLTE